MNICKKTVDYSAADLATILQTNLSSVFELCQQLYPFLKVSSYSSIVNVSSVAGLTAICTGAPYGITKAALIQFTRNLALE